MSAAGVALMLGGAGILLAAGPAEAAEVSYRTECVPPPISGLPPVQGTTKVLVTAPAEAKVGDEVEVVWKTVEAASKNPDILDLDKDTVKPTGTLKVAGAQTADLAMEGPRQNPPIPKNSPMVLPDMKGTLKLTAAGEVTLTPGAYSINVSKPLSTDTKCAPKEAVRPSATIKVTEAGGGTSGGTTTSGGTDSGGTTTSGGTTSGGTDSGGTTMSGGTTAGGTTTGGTTTGGTTSSGGSTGGGTGGSTGGGGGPTDFEGKEVSVAYACKTPIGDKNATSPVKINAKRGGGSYDLTVKFSKSVMDSPADIPADSVKPSMEVKLGGADQGFVHVEGPANKEPIKAGAPIAVPDLTGTYKPGATGKATLSPGVLTVKALGTTTTCTPPANVQVSLELDTSAQPGGASGGSGTGGSTSGGSGTGGTGGTGGGGSGGGLADTGAEDGGALRALALVAGTALLLGGAVFTFTPRRLLRR
ncbi:hypothetical protein [Streptomyces ficellus]|uniref:LPXTG cell wall anchor domain-containing protein n=1 Tax=Streptomyces ficellus TaxID=1977088 RepID=A0A6I6FXF6_9ACTN|nr:hypothetical protein [Streptomyces ficellus]QGV82768.1 hypothetical protein EIZ62_20060 [Streptomyces ficellus]